jgi:hypothetical protein
VTHRLSVTLTDEQYDRLQRLAASKRLRLSDLVRDAVEWSYPQRVVESVETANPMESWLGLDGAHYVELVRGPGLGYCLASLGYVPEVREDTDEKS